MHSYSPLAATAFFSGSSGHIPKGRFFAESGMLRCSSRLGHVGPSVKPFLHHRSFSRLGRHRSNKVAGRVRTAQATGAIGDTSDGLEVGQAIALVWFEMVSFGPFIPGVDENKPTLGWQGLGVRDELFQVLFESLRGAVEVYNPVAAASR